MAAKSAHLLIILGSPASGKSTLARRLSGDLRLPCISKDDIKEALFDVLGCNDRATSRRLSEASFAAVARIARAQLAAGQSLIIEGNWRAVHTALLKAMLSDAEAPLAQIRCAAEAREIMRRFTARRRHPGHLDASLPSGDLAAAAAEPAEFLELAGPRWLYQSGAPAAYAALLEQVKSWRL